MPTSTLPRRNSAADACTKLTLWRAATIGLAADDAHAIMKPLPSGRRG
jgi:hypothetical protein